MLLTPLRKQVAWNVGWGEHDLEETEIIIERPLAPQGHTPSPVAPELSHSPLLSDEEPEEEAAANEGGWETMDEDEPSSAALRAPARSGSSTGSSRSSQRLRLPDVPSLTLSTSTTTSSLPTLSPSCDRTAAGRRNLSSDSGRYEEVIHERDEDGPLTPIDGEEELLKPPRPLLQPPSPAPSSAERVLLTKENGDPKRVRLDSLDLDVGNAPARMQRPV